MMKKSITKWFVTFFGSGLAPKAPGTFGTLAAIPLTMLLSHTNTFIYMGFTLVLILISIVIVDQYQRTVGGHDRKEIVIDEVIGFLITMTWMPQTWQAYVIGFILFRIFDIWKPLFIGYLDSKLKGGFGVIADDMAAGIVASIIMQVLYTHTAFLGQQLLNLN